MIMRDLIERLEKLAGPCAECDVRAQAIAEGYSLISGIEGDHVILARQDGSQFMLRAPYAVPAYTASIDAALTLAPEGANSHGYDFQCGLVEAYVSRSDVSNGHWYVQAEHPTSPAIALCIAALKARMITSDACGQPPTKGDLKL